MYKSGFVSIIGRPNVGKSTLLNGILGQKISIISSTSQTTRNTIKGIYSTSDCQIVFIDTPGIHKPQNELGKYMNSQSLNSLNDVDAILWVVDVTKRFGAGDEFVINSLKKMNVPIILCFNKMDLINEDSTLEFSEDLKKFTSALEFAKVEYICANDSHNIENLLLDIKECLPEGPQYYDNDQITDKVERFIASEIIREKIFYLTKDEVPHSVAVEIEEMKELEENTEIYACIVCDRESLKKILIGKDASMIKKIKKYAKRDIEKLLNKHVYLELFVKVDRDWRNNKATLARLGYKS